MGNGMAKFTFKRTITRIGNHSKYVSLPAVWINENKINFGRFIQWETTENNDELLLRVIPPG